MDNDKQFTIKEGDQEVLLTFMEPDFEQLEEAKKVYARTVSKLLKSQEDSDLLSRSQLEAILEKKGIWTQEDRKAIEDLQNKIADKYRQLKAGGRSKKEGFKDAIEMNRLRRDILKITAKRQQYDDVTIESLAEEEQKNYLVFSCVRREDGSTYWDSFEDMKEDRSSKAFMEGNRIALNYVYDIDPDFEKNLPENKWLKKYKFVDDELNYIDPKTGEQVDVDGKSLEESDKKGIEILQSILFPFEEDQPYYDEESEEEVKEELAETK